MPVIKFIPMLLFLSACAFAEMFGIGELLALAGGIVSELLKFRNLNLKPSAFRLCKQCYSIDMPK